MKRSEEVRISTIIGCGSLCGGDFSAPDSARVDGNVDGSVTVENTLIVGSTGNIKGDISAKRVIVGGEVIGNIAAPEKVELTSSARVIGDIITSVLVIDEKAVFQGGCNMNQDVNTKRQKVSGRTVRATKKSAKAAIAEALREVEAQNIIEEAESSQNTDNINE